LEKIFIEKRIYRDIEECTTWEAVIKAIDKGLKPHVKKLRRKVTVEDIVRLTEIKIKRISKYDGFKANEQIKSVEGELAEVEKNLRNLTRYAVRYFENLKKTYSKGRERRTEISGFERVDRTQVVAATETLYLDEKGGFAGWSLKRDKSLEKCSRLDDLISFSLDAQMRVMKISDKAFVGTRPVHVAVFRKDEPKVYSMVYREGKSGPLMAKRFLVGGVTRDKIYEMGKGTKGSRVLYFAVHDSEKESDQNEVVVHMKSGLGLRNLTRPVYFKEIALKGRGARGITITKHPVDRVVRAAK
jgi:topoisomerase-4 subunit A